MEKTIKDLKAKDAFIFRRAAEHMPELGTFLGRSPNGKFVVLNVGGKHAVVQADQCHVLDVLPEGVPGVELPDPETVIADFVKANPDAFKGPKGDKGDKGDPGENA